MGLRPKPRLRGKEYMRGSASRSARDFFEKSPRDPKKRNGKGIYYQAEIANKAAVGSLVFLFIASCSYSFSAEVKKLKVRSTKIIPRNKTKQARPSSLLLLSMGAAFFTFASKTSIVSKNYAEVNSSNLSGLKHTLCLSAHGHNQEKGLDS